MSMRQYVQQVQTQKYSTVGAAEGGIESEGFSVGTEVGFFVLCMICVLIVSINQNNGCIHKIGDQYRFVLTERLKEWKLETSLVKKMDSSMDSLWEQPKVCVIMSDPTSVIELA